MKERIKKALEKFLKYFVVLALAYVAGIVLHWGFGTPKPDIAMVYTWAILVFMAEIAGRKIF